MGSWDVGAELKVAIQLPVTVSEHLEHEGATLNELSWWTVDILAIRIMSSSGWKCDI